MPHPHRLLPPLLLVALAFLLRAPSWPISVIDWDESMFALAARELLAGHLPYTTMFDNKPVGLTLLFAAAMAIAGETVVAVRLLGALCVATTAVLLCVMTRIVVGRWEAGFAAGLLYAAYSSGLHGLATHTEIVLAPFTTAGILVAVRGRGERASTQLATIAGAGLVFGLALTIKQIAALPASATFIVLALSWRVDGRTSLARLAALGALYALFCALPTLIAAIAYATEGQLAAFWYANVGFMGHYVAERPPLPASLRFISGAAIEFWPLLALGAGGLIAGRRGRPGRITLVLGGWLGAETIAALASLQFYSHHFLVMLPPLAVLSGMSLAALSERRVGADTRVATVLSASAFLALIPLAPSLHAAGWASFAGPDLPRRVAEVVRGEASADQVTWVVNFQPVVYLLAGLPLPTALPFPPHLVGDQTRLSPVDPDAEIARILRSRPSLLVVDRGRWGGMRAGAIALVGHALSSRYALLTTVTDGPQRIEIYALR